MIYVVAIQPSARSSSQKLIFVVRCYCLSNLVGTFSIGNRDNFNKENFDREMFSRDIFDREHFNKEKFSREMFSRDI